MTRRPGLFGGMLRLGPFTYGSYLYRGHLRTFSWSTYRDNWRLWRDGAPDGLPLPSSYLRFQVIGEISAQRFLDTGHRQVMGLMLPLLERHGLRFEELRSVLDFGCGCGRILRQWESRLPERLVGVDVNPRLVRWCQRHLAFAEVSTSSPVPPLGFADGSFDFVYARSIFTHLDETSEAVWIGEIHRILEPGGVLLFTVSGDRFIDAMEPAELERYQAGDVVVRSAELSGMNQCAAFHPRAYVERAWLKAGFEILEWVEGGRLPEAVQDTYLVRRSSS